MASFFTRLSPAFRPPSHAPRLTGRRRIALVILALLLACLAWTALLRHEPYELDDDALKAASIMRRGMSALKDMRTSLHLPIDPVLDPAGTGLIGTDYSDLTTSIGSLSAKQTTLNPAFAGLVTAWLKQAGVSAGDPVAVCLTGSFPALNLAVLSACQALDLRPTIFASVGASNYGANIPGFTWLDMERRLTDLGILRVRTNFASLGGIADTGGGLDETGYELGEAAIRRHGALYVPEKGVEGLLPDMERRMRIYTGNGLPRAFINVGGGVTSLGWVSEAALLDNGLLKRLPTTNSRQRGIIFRMYEQHVPVIHLINIERLASRYGLPVAPQSLPEEQDGRKNRLHTLAGAALLLGLWWLLAVVAIMTFPGPEA